MRGSRFLNSRVRVGEIEILEFEKSDVLVRQFVSLDIDRRAAQPTGRFLKLCA